jgi:hypothetical protein
MWLESERQAGRIKWWRRQIPIKLEVNGKLICRIVVDFKICLPSGDIEFHEVKGRATRTPLYNLKLKLLRALYPELTYKIIE